MQHQQHFTSQESYKSARAQAVKKKVELEDSVEPIISEIFRFIIFHQQKLKKQLLQNYSHQLHQAGSFIPIQVTEEPTTRSIIVRGKEKDLDVVDKVIREIDVELNKF